MSNNYDLRDFEEQVIERSRQVPVLVDFWAAWCGPCKMLGPVVEKLAAEASGAWELVKVDTDRDAELAEQFGIRGIPNLKLFHQGEVIAELAGALPEPQLREWLRDQLPTPRREAMARAEKLIREGHANEAADVLVPLAEADPDDHELAALAARAHVFGDPNEAVALIAELPPSAPLADSAQIVRDFAHLFSIEEAGGGKLPADALRQRYLDGIRSLRRERYADALSHLISVLQERPGYDEGRAKSACLAIFRHLGMRHPTTEEHLRAFSMAVNA